MQVVGHNEEALVIRVTLKVSIYVSICTVKALKLWLATLAVEVAGEYVESEQGFS